MKNIRQQVFLLAVGPLIAVTLITLPILGVISRENAVYAETTKVKSDLANGEAILEYLYPGTWESKDGLLYKGGIRINQNYIPVDRIAALSDDNVSIFCGDTRISTTIRTNDGERAIGTKAAEHVSASVLKDGQLYIGEANVAGAAPMTGYKPIRDKNGNIIGMISVGISQKFVDHLWRDYFLIMIACNLAVAAAVGAVFWLFARRSVSGPLERMTNNLWEVATSYGIDYSHPATVGGLAQGCENFLRMRTEAVDESSAAVETAAPDNNVPAAGQASPVGQEPNPNEFTYIEPFPSSSQVVPMPLKEELPKGLNRTTMQQIVTFLLSRNEPMSAEEVGEGVNITRVTARRYLEYLENSGRVKIIIRYGTVGRPVKLYKAILREQ